MERWEKNCIKLIHKFFWNCSKFIKQNKYSFYRISIVTKAVEFYSTPFVFFTDTLTGKFICGRDPSYNHLLKSLRVAIATNQISLSFPHKDVSLRNLWYLSIPQLVLIIFDMFFIFGHFWSFFDVFIHFTIIFLKIILINNSVFRI